MKIYIVEYFINAAWGLRSVDNYDAFVKSIPHTNYTTASAQATKYTGDASPHKRVIGGVTHYFFGKAQSRTATIVVHNVGESK